jgi:hypothetical protein
MADEDAELVALIDKEHDEGTRLALLARFATDERLRRRYDELRTAGAPIAGSLEELLRQAPLEWLRAAILVMDPFASRRPIRQQRTATPCGWHCDWAPGGRRSRMWCGGLWAAEASGGLAFGRRPIHEPLHQPDLQSFEPGRLAANDRTGGAWGQGGGHQPDPRKRGPPGPAIYGCLHALLQGFAVGRDRLRRPLGRAGLALHHRQSPPDAPIRSEGRATVFAIVLSYLALTWPRSGAAIAIHVRWQCAAKSAHA